MSKNALFRNAACGLALFAGLSIGLLGCGDASTDSTNNQTISGEFEIVGVYKSNFGANMTITEESWTTSTEEFGSNVAAIDSFDNAQNFVITQNAADAAYSPGAFNKIVWTEPTDDGSFYYCTVAFGLATAEEAKSSGEAPDDSDPSSGGCANAPWTKLTPQSTQN
jgi:hypothetical protein